MCLPYYSSLNGNVSSGYINPQCVRLQVWTKLEAFENSEDISTGFEPEKRPSLGVLPTVPVQEHLTVRQLLLNFQENIVNMKNLEFKKLHGTASLKCGNILQCRSKCTVYCTPCTASTVQCTQHNINKSSYNFVPQQKQTDCRIQLFAPGEQKIPIYLCNCFLRYLLYVYCIDR